MQLSTQNRLTLLWLLVGTIGVMVCCLIYPAAHLGTEFVPVGNDSFYHARRILDAAADPSAFYQFDPKIAAPEGSIVVWPWGYDYALAWIVRIAMLAGFPGEPIGFLIWIPVAPHHDARTYEVTGPELLTFADAAAAISAATDRPLRVTSVSPADYLAGAIADGVPEPIAALLTDVFTQVLDGRNAYLGTGTLDALGRPAATFGAYVRRAAAEGAWSDVAADDAHVEVAR